MEIYLTVITGILFCISETLPFISKVKGNGILQILSSLGKKVIHNPENERFLPIIDNLGNILGNNENDNKIEILNIDNVDNDNDKDNNDNNRSSNNSNVQGDLFLFIKQSIQDIKNILITYEKTKTNNNNNNEKTIQYLQQNTCNILMRPTDYELEYISNFIKFNYPIRNLNIKILSNETIDALRSLNYIINYDSINDIYNIKW